MPGALRPPHAIDDRRRGRRRAMFVFAALFLAYNANGREIGTVDSQPLKYLAQELVARHTFALDHTVALKPGLGERPEFAHGRDGHVRSGRPILSGVLAAGPAWLLAATRLVDPDAPMAPNLFAKLTASAITAFAMTLVFLTLVRLFGARPAAWTTVALGLGTNYWGVVSQTLWQHETVALGIAMYGWATLRPADRTSIADVICAGLGLALAGMARPQTAPLVAVLTLALVARLRVRALPAVAILVAAVGATMALNEAWFGQPLGGLSQLQALNPAIHAESSAYSARPWIGLAGLLVSPSRGILVFSPIVLILALGIPTMVRDRTFGFRWLCAAACVQLLAYASYSVWWAGHTFGPRFALDLLVPLAPAGAAGFLQISARRWTTAVAGLLLVWSVGIAGLGAFVYPNERWNTSPSEIDVDHGRLWHWRDSQIVRAVHTAPSPQNFDLWTRAAFRR